MSELRHRPTVADLLEALREHLLAEAAGSEERRRYLARVAAGVVAVVERELAAGGEVERRERQALGRLGFADATDLAAALRRGDLDGRLAEVAAALRPTVDDRLRIDNPAYLDAP